MKVILTAVVVGVVLLSLGAWFVTSGASAGGIPPGVDPALWHPITDRLGLALRQERSMGRQMEFVGTLMLKSENAWQPVHLEAPGPRVRPVQ